MDIQTAHRRLLCVDSTVSHTHIVLHFHLILKELGHDEQVLHPIHIGSALQCSDVEVPIQVINEQALYISYRSFVNDFSLFLVDLNESDVTAASICIRCRRCDDTCWTLYSYHHRPHRIIKMLRGIYKLKNRPGLARI